MFAIFLFIEGSGTIRALWSMCTETTVPSNHSILYNTNSDTHFNGFFILFKFIYGVLISRFLCSELKPRIRGLLFLLGIYHFYGVTC